MIAARKPAAIAATGPVPGSVSPPGPTASRLLARLAEQPPGTVGERLSLVLGELLRRAEAACSPPPTSRIPVSPDPPRLRVDVDGAAADEAAERDAAVGGEVDGEARRRADRDENRATGDGGLLDELEREPPADAEHVLGERQQPLPKGPADDLVHRVVPADVLAHAQAARRSRENSPVAWRPPVDRERGLRLAQPVRKRGDEPTAAAAAPDSTRGASTATASSAPFPQTPHEDEV